jgi:hypothetical protein
MEFDMNNDDNIDGIETYSFGDFYVECINQEEAIEAEMKGYLEVTLKSNEGKEYNLYFIDIVRLTQDLRTEIKQCYNFCIGIKNLVVIEEVTPQNICNSIYQLIDEGYFND